MHRDLKLSAFWGALIVLVGFCFPFTTSAQGADGPKLTISAPDSGSVVAITGGTAQATVTYDITSWPMTPGGNVLRWYLDDALVGTQTSPGPYTFTGLTQGVHRLTGVPTDSQDQELHEGRDSVQIKVVGPCQNASDCFDNNDCSIETCRPLSSGPTCAYAITGKTGCCASSFDCPVGNVCDGGICVQCAGSADCDDGDACTIDTCDQGQCSHAPSPDCCATAADCDDGLTCTVDICHPVLSKCVHPTAKLPGCCSTDDDCGDANPCTYSTCNADAHRCVRSWVPSCCLNDWDCDDGNPATLDACDTQTHTCGHEPDPTWCGGSCPPPSPPVFNPVIDATVEEGSFQLVFVSATDADTPVNQLEFALINGPSWAFVLQTGIGSGAVGLQPLAGDAGDYQIIVGVTDGEFSDVVVLNVLVTAATGGGPDTPGVKYVIIRDANGGTGAPVGDLTLDVGTSTTLVAAGYNAALSYLRDINVLWETTGTLDPVDAGPAKSLSFSPTTAGTIGKIRVTHPDADISGDQTGVITIPPNPPSPASAPDSVLSTSKPALIADGLDSTTLAVTVKDANGNTITETNTVTFDANGGVLGPEVVDQGDGTYIQTLTSKLTEEDIAVTATVNGEPIGTTLLIPSRKLIDLVFEEIEYIDCNNYEDFKGKNLLISDGAVEINSTFCAPMEFGHIILSNKGVLTHGATGGGIEQKIDLRAASLSVDSTSKIEVNFAWIPPVKSKSINGVTPRWMVGKMSQT